METTWISEAGEVIIRLLEAGGEKAIGALLWYLTYLLLRIILIGGVVCSVIWAISQAVRGSLTAYSERKLERITLLSEEVSKRWEGSFRQALEHLEDAVTKFEIQLDSLKTAPGTSSATTTEEQEPKSKSDEPD